MAVALEDVVSITHSFDSQYVFLLYFVCGVSWCVNVYFVSVL